MKVLDGISHSRLYSPCLISMSITKDTKFLNMFIFLSYTIPLLNHSLTWTGSYLGILILSPAMAKSSMHPSSITGIMPSTTTIDPFSAKTPSIRTYDIHRGCWNQWRLKMSLTSYMPYLQEMLVDEYIEELERKEKQSEDFRNSLEFLKNSPFHPLFPFNVIQCSPPNQNQWRNQNNSGNQHQRSSKNSYQQQPGSGQPNDQKKYKESKWPYKPGKQQKREWFDKRHQNPKGKGKAQAHKVVVFINKVVMALEEEEAFAYLESILEMETEQMEIIKEDTGMDITEPLSMPFHFHFLECLFWQEQDTSRAKEEVKKDQVLSWRSHF